MFVNMVCHPTFWKACVIIMLPCEVSKQLAKQLAPWLGSPASGQNRSAQIQQESGISAPHHRTNRGDLSDCHQYFHP